MTSSRDVIKKGETDGPANGLCELPRAPACFYARIFRTHVTRMQDPPAQLARVRRYVIRLCGFASDAPRVSYHLCVYSATHQQASVGGEDIKWIKRTPAARRIDGQSTHRVNDDSRRTAIDAATKRQKIPLRARAAKVVPQPASGAQPCVRPTSIRRRGQRQAGPTTECNARYLLLGRVVPHLILPHRRPVALLDRVELAAGERDGRLDAVVALRAGGLHTTAALRAVRAHVLNVDRRRDDLDVGEGELRALGDDAPVERDHRTTVVVQSITIAALLVRIEVHTAELHRQQGVRFLSETEKGGMSGRLYLESSLFDKLNARVELPELVVAPTRVGKDFDAIEAHEDVGAAKRMRRGSFSSTKLYSTVPRRREELLTQLNSDARIDRTHDAVPKRHLDLSHLSHQRKPKKKRNCAYVPGR